MPQSRIHNHFTLVLVMLGIAARIAAVIVLRSPTLPRSTYEHGEIAANLLTGRGFSTHFLGAFGPTSQQAPVYPFLVAGAFALGGIETERSLWILQLAQCALGGLLVWGVIRLANRWVPRCPAVGWIAGLIAALHPTLVYCATHVQVAGLAATLLVWFLLLGEEAAGLGRTRALVWSGLVLGILILSDPIMGLAALALPLAYARNRAWGDGIRGCLVTAGITSLVVAPWIARNYAVHGEFVPVKSSFGYAFWQGNCRLSEGTDKVVRASVDRIFEKSSGSLREQNAALWAARHEAGYLDDIALSQADKAFLGRHSEPERSRILLARALGELNEDAGRYARLCLRRLQYFWLFDETNPKTRVWLYRAPHLALSVFALFGLGIALAQRRGAIVPGLVVVLSIALFHVLTITSARFHIPIEPVMTIWAAIGVHGIASTIGKRHRAHFFTSASAGMVPRPHVPGFAYPRRPTVS